MHIRYTVVRSRQRDTFRDSGRGEAGQDSPVWKRGRQETQSSLSNGQILCVGIMKIFILEVEKVLCYPSWQACPLALREELTCSPWFLALSFGVFYCLLFSMARSKVGPGKYTPFLWQIPFKAGFLLMQVKKPEGLSVWSIYRLLPSVCATRT